jgi:hypothetical protein
VLIEVSPGEAIDRLTILEIKTERIKEQTKLRDVRDQYLALLHIVCNDLLMPQEALDAWARLKHVNEHLWRVEEALREHENSGHFGQEFVDLARSVYIHNDLRSDLKRIINEAVGSKLGEVKSYAGS